MNGKTGWSLLAALVIMCATFPARGASLPSDVAPEGERELRVLCAEVGAPYVFDDGEGNLRGIYIDLLRSIAAKAQLNFMISLAPPANRTLDIFAIRPDIVVGPVYSSPADPGLLGYSPVHYIDLMNSSVEKELFHIASAVPDGRKNLACFAMPFLWELSTLFLRADEENRLDGLRGRKIGAVADSYEARLMKELGFDGEVVVCSSVSEGMEKLLAGECDAFVAETCQGQYSLSGTPSSKHLICAVQPPLRSYERSLFVLHGDAVLAQKIARAVYEMRLSGRYNQIIGRWVGNDEEYMLSFSLLMKIAAAFLLVVGVVLVWNYELKRKIRIASAERQRILDFVHDGILAVDRNGRIVNFNSRAKEMLGLDDDDLKKSADELIPGLGIQVVIDSSRPVYNLEQTLRDAVVSCTKVPMTVRGRSFGALVTMRNLSELQAMAEEMTGVKMYVESLRVHNHEFMNTLQAISGLIQLKQYDKALKYIEAETDSNQSVQSFMTERIKSAAICGVLMGKAGVCREQHIKFILAPDSFCDDHNDRISDRSLVVIVGNLIQNAIEAHLQKGVSADAQIQFSIYDELGSIALSVRDNAGMMTPAIARRLYDVGFSTKDKGRPSGFGLFSIHNLIESLDGDISVDYVTGEYTDFTVSIPIPEKQEELPHA
ncbi:MAG: Spo0B domain-containing protein [Pyramidobacter sp.]